MNREQFRQILNDRPVVDAPSFLEYFSVCLNRIQANYSSLNPKIPNHRRDFNVVGVEDALTSYAWPAKVSYLHAPNDTLNIIDYDESFAALNHFSEGLQQAISNNSDVTAWSKKILRWGMGNRGKAAYRFLCELDDAPAYLRRINEMSDLDGDTDQIIASEILKYNSGLSKIHSLASTSGLIIYDSRVAFAIAECVNKWAMSIGLPQLPAALTFMQAGRRPCDPDEKKPLKPRGNELSAYTHPAEKRDHRWLETQMRASWLFEVALIDNSHLWPDQELNVRMHNLEAAFFMLGAYAETITLPQAA